MLGESRRVATITPRVDRRVAEIFAGQSRGSSTSWSLFFLLESGLPRPAARTDTPLRMKNGGRHEARRRMLLRRSALCGRRRADAEGAMPLSRMPVHHRRFAQHVRGDATGRLQIHQGRAEAVYPQGPGEAGHARVLRRVRHACGDASPAAAGRGQGRHAGRSHADHAADRDLHRRKQPFHHVPEGMPAFERLPQR
jgi:hypothetical protein